jgi:hypothetical protein
MLVIIHTKLTRCLDAFLFSYSQLLFRKEIWYSKKKLAPGNPSAHTVYGQCFHFF